MTDPVSDRTTPNRRTILQGATFTAAAALSAASYRRVLGANERVGVGFIGKRHVLDFKAQPDADMVERNEPEAAVVIQKTCSCAVKPWNKAANSSSRRSGPGRCRNEWPSSRLACPRTNTQTRSLAVVRL